MCCHVVMRMMLAYEHLWLGEDLTYFSVCRVIIAGVLTLFVAETEQVIWSCYSKLRETES